MSLLALGAFAWRLLALKEGMLSMRWPVCGAMYSAGGVKPSGLSDGHRLRVGQFTPRAGSNTAGADR